MKKYNLKNDSGRNVSFVGELLSDVSSHHYQGPRQNRWTELDCYRTKAGKLVLQITGRTLWQGEGDRCEVVVCDDEAALIDALERDNDGVLGSLAKELLEGMSVSADTVVE